jgi:hypothetical protein
MTVEYDHKTLLPPTKSEHDTTLWSLFDSFHHEANTSVSSACRHRHGVGRGKPLTDPSPGTIPLICSPSPSFVTSYPPPFKFTHHTFFFFSYVFLNIVSSQGMVENSTWFIVLVWIRIVTVSLRVFLMKPSIVWDGHTKNYTRGNFSCMIGKTSFQTSSIVKVKTFSCPNVHISVLVVTSVLTSVDVRLTSGNRSPDETDGTTGSVTPSIFVRFTSNLVHLHPLPPLQERVMSRFSLINFFLPKFLLDGNLEINDGKGNVKGVRRSRVTEGVYHCTWAPDLWRTPLQYILCRRPCHPNTRKSHGTRRHTSVNRTETQASKVWTYTQECIETVSIHN